MSKISFQKADFAFRLNNRTSIRNIIMKILTDEHKSWNSINFIFCTDDYLLSINRKFLHHDFYTDVITFPIYETDDVISAEIYISIDRIKENAKKYKVPYQNELLRVIVHGILHLCGYKDKEKIEKRDMRNKENYYLNELSFT